MCNIESSWQNVTIVVILGFGALWSGSALAQTTVPDEPLAISTSIGMKTLGQRSPIALSSDGRYLVYPECVPQRQSSGASEPDSEGGFDKLAEWGAGCTPMVEDLTSGKTTRITVDGRDGWNAQWSPSGHRIAFLSVANGKSVLYVKELGGPARLIGPAHSWYLPWWIGADKVVYAAPVPRTQWAVHQKHGSPYLLHSSVPGAHVTVYRSQSDLSPAERKLIRDTALTEQAGTADRWTVNLVAVDLTSGTETVLERGARFPYALPGIVAISPNRKYIAYELYRGKAKADAAGQSLFSIVLTSVDQPGDRHVLADHVLGLPSAQRLAWSPDGRYLAWFSNGLTDTGILYVYDVQRGELRRVLDGSPQRGAARPDSSVPHFNSGGWTSATYFNGASPVWLDAHTIVTKVYRGPPDAHPVVKESTEIWAIDVVSGRTRKVGAIPGGMIWGILTRAGSANAWVHDGELMLRMETSDHDDALGAIDIASGRYRAVAGGHGSFWFFSAAPLPTSTPDGSSALLVRQSATEPPDVWLQPADGGAPRQLTHLNPGMSFTHFGSLRMLHYAGADGKMLRAALLLPPGYRPGHPVPLIVNTYVVSDWSALARQFAFEGGSDNPLLLTSRGYAVLFPDIPVEAGQTGGREITNAVLASVDAAISEGYADSTRLGITGHSYGGYAVYSVIVRSHRFRAAVVRSGFPNWIATYLTMSDDGSSEWGIANAEGVRGPGGTLWEKRDQFIEDSPIFFFDRITTPTLIVHGTKDYLAATNATMAFVALRRLGKDAVLALYDGEEHVQSEYTVPDQTDYVQREIEWFDRHLCPQRVSRTSCTP